MAIRNFINFRGSPREMYSDNGSCFTGADNELKRELAQLNVQELGETFSSCYLKWNFNPPASPHMGGMWERLIRTVKTCMKESMTSRTPNHFILGNSNGLKPPGQFTDDGPYLRSARKESQRCTNIFWKRFVNEYISTLTRKTKWFEYVKPLEVGDVVINFDADQPRNAYTLARIVETIIGSKTQVRRAKIQFANGKTLWRPAVRLGLLDVKSSTPTIERSLDHPDQKIETEGSIVGAEKSNEVSSTSVGMMPSTEAAGTAGMVDYEGDISTEGN